MSDSVYFAHALLDKNKLSERLKEIILSKIPELSELSGKDCKGNEVPLIRQVTTCSNNRELFIRAEAYVGRNCQEHWICRTDDEKAGPGNANTKHFVVQFSIDTMPGNMRVGVSTGSYVSEEFRGRGLATALQAFKEDICRQVGIKLLLATVRDDNLAELNVLQKAGWQESPESMSLPALVDVECCSNEEDPNVKIRFFYKRIPASAQEVST